MRAVWLLLASPEVIPQEAHDREARDGKRCINSKAKGIHIARSPDGLGSVRPQFARSSCGWGGRTMMSNLKSYRRMRKEARTQDCPLFASRPSRSRPATIGIRLIVPQTGCSRLPTPNTNKTNARSVFSQTRSLRGPGVEKLVDPARERLLSCVRETISGPAANGRAAAKRRGSRVLMVNETFLNPTAGAAWGFLFAPAPATRHNS